MSETVPEWGTIVTEIINAIKNIIYQTASTIADNAAAVGGLVAMGLIGYMLYRYGGRMFSGLLRFFRW